MEPGAREIQSSGQVCRRQCGMFSDAGSTPAASTIIQLITRFSRIILREGGFCFCPYIQGLWRICHLSKPFSDHLIFPIFQPFILCLAPDSPFCSDLVRNASGKLYPCPVRVYVKSSFQVVVLSLHSVLHPDLFFELTVRRTEKKRNNSGFPIFGRRLKVSGSIYFCKIKMLWYISP